jgi:hypothetical protein
MEDKPMSETLDLARVAVSFIALGLATLSVIPLLRASFGGSVEGVLGGLTVTGVLLLSWYSLQDSSKEGSR